ATTPPAGFFFWSMRHGRDPDPGAGPDLCRRGRGDGRAIAVLFLGDHRPAVLSHRAVGRAWPDGRLSPVPAPGAASALGGDPGPHPRGPWRPRDPDRDHPDVAHYASPV